VLSHIGVTISFAVPSRGFNQDGELTLVDDDEENELTNPFSNTVKKYRKPVRVGLR
jgi:hypothetical protein